MILWIWCYMCVKVISDSLIFVWLHCSLDFFVNENREAPMWQCDTCHVMSLQLHSWCVIDNMFLCLKVIFCYFEWSFRDPIFSSHVPSLLEFTKEKVCWYYHKRFQLLNENVSSEEWSLKNLSHWRNAVQVKFREAPRQIRCCCQLFAHFKCLQQCFWRTVHHASDS